PVGLEELEGRPDGGTEQRLTRGRSRRKGGPPWPRRPWSWRGSPSWRTPAWRRRGSGRGAVPLPPRRPPAASWSPRASRLDPGRPETAEDRFGLGHEPAHEVTGGHDLLDRAGALARRVALPLRVHPRRGV